MAMPHLIRDEHGKASFRLQIADCPKEFWEAHLRKLGFAFSDGISTLQTTDRLTYESASDAMRRLGVEFPAAEKKKPKPAQVNHLVQPQTARMLPRYRTTDEHRVESPREQILESFLAKSNNIRLLERGLTPIRKEFRLRWDRFHPYESDHVNHTNAS
jgi:hypothetical protein